MRLLLTNFLIFLLFFHFSAMAETRIQANDSKIHYIGRTVIEKGAVSSDWSGFTAVVEFQGTSLSMEYGDTHCTWLNVWIDRVPDEKSDAIYKLGGEQLTIAGNLQEGKHRIVIQKRTEGEQGRLTFKSFSTDGRFLKAEKTTTRLMEFIGDSYTCGYGTESKSGTERFSPATENCNLTYAAILGRTFGSEVRFISHSGRGVVRNYGGYDKDLPMYLKYSQAYDCDTTLNWIPSKGEAKPAIVVIYLGTNDFSCGEHPTLERWCETYGILIAKVKANYGKDIPVLCVASKADELMPEYVMEAVKRCGFANVHYAAISPAAHNESDELGADSHPNYKGHRKVALCMMSYISTLTGWELPEFIH